MSSNPKPWPRPEEEPHVAARRELGLPAMQRDDDHVQLLLLLAIADELRLVRMALEERIA